jgi:transketolase
VDTRNWRKQAIVLRRTILELSGCVSNASHLGGALSLVDVFLVVNGLILGHCSGGSPKKHGTVILSKGHAVLIIYASLVLSGKLSRETFEKEYESGVGKLLGHPVRNIDLGIDFSTGSLGMGLGLGVGRAIALRDKGTPQRVVVYLGDGELGEGSNYEAIQIASMLKLENLLCVVDLNKVQQTGLTRDLTGLTDFRAVFEGFGWTVFEADGHDFQSLVPEVEQIDEFMSEASSGPCVLLVDTVKGKGLGSELEGSVASHHLLLTDDMRKISIGKMNREMDELNGTT